MMNDVRNAAVTVSFKGLTKAEAYYFCNDVVPLLYDLVALILDLDAEKLSGEREENGE